jgi:hypothetical protein
MTAIELRHEALMMLEGKGAILDVARRVTCILEKTHTPGAIIGGVAVALHGHIRTTADVDVFVGGSVEEFSQALIAAGVQFIPLKREFIWGNVPIHLLTVRQTGFEPSDSMMVDEVRIVSLADLINLKLTSGLRHVTRAQDLADVIGLIRSRRLTSRFAARLGKPLRGEFRKLVKAVREETVDRR